jgi:hypothetical protein
VAEIAICNVPLLVLGGNAGFDVTEAARAMTVRRRILLAALALVVIATACHRRVVGPEDSTPKLSFTLCGYSNSSQSRVVAVTNCERCTVSLNDIRIQLEGEQLGLPSTTLPLPVTLSGGSSRTISLPVYIPPDVGSHAARQVGCFVQRETFANKLRRKMPLIGRIDDPQSYHIPSEMFTQ